MNLQNAIVTNVSTRKDGCVKIVLETRQLSPEQFVEIFANINQEVISIDIPNDGEVKTKSQRLRGVLYKVYETNETLHDRFTTFAVYYDSVFDMLIDKYKEKIL